MRTGAVLVELEATVVNQTCTYGDPEQRDGRVAVAAREQHVGEQLASALGAHAGDVEGGVEQVGAVERRDGPDRRRRKTCTHSWNWLPEQTSALL